MVASTSTYESPAHQLLLTLLGAPSHILPQLLINKSIISTLSDLLLSSSSSLSLTVRQLLHDLFDKLSTIPGTLSFQLLACYATQYQSTNATLVSSLITRAFSIDESLLDQLISIGPDSLHLAFGNQPTSSLTLDDFIQRARVHLRMARSASVVASIYGQSIEVVRTLCYWYDVLLPKLRPASTLSTLGSNFKEVDEAGRSWLEIRLEVLETFHSILAAAYLSLLAMDPPPSERIALTEELESILLASLDRAESLSAPTGAVGGQPLISRTLLADLDGYFKIGATLDLEKGMRKSILIERFTTLRVVERMRQNGGEIVDGLEVLRRPSSSVIKSNETAPVESNGKGKGKELSPIVSSRTPPHLSELDTAPAVSQILELFPDHSPSHLRQILLHPRYNGSAEKVISSLLEDDLPFELRGGVKDEEEKVEGREEVKKPMLAASRRNIFDGQQMNAASMTRGKESSQSADTLLSDRSFMTSQIKASIISRAEAESSDEDSDEDEQHTEAFLEDFDDVTLRRDIKVGGDGHDDEEGEGENVDGENGVNGPATKPAVVTPAHDPLANPITPTIANLLETTYLSDPSVFERTSLAKKSKARASLREKSGLADEQIEGWKVMLERNPKKDKILAKHAFSGNKPDTTDDTQANPQQPQQSSESTRGGRGGARGGRGGDGRGGGRGKGDGGRAASNRRTRGNDKKMAKVA